MNSQQSVGVSAKWRLFWLCEALAFVSGKDKCAWMCGGFPFSLCSKNSFVIQSLVSVFLQWTVTHGANCMWRSCEKCSIVVLNCSHGTQILYNTFVPAITDSPCWQLAALFSCRLFFFLFILSCINFSRTCIYFIRMFIYFSGGFIYRYLKFVQSS